MPTECERSITSSATTKISPTEVKDCNSAAVITNVNEDLPQQSNSMMEGGGDMSTSQTSTTSNGSSSCNGGGRKTSITSPDPTAYVAKARVTRPTPPPPPYNPMQFVQIKPCNLYQTAQEQLKKAEEVKKIKEIRKEEPEDWQNNLDNWKSSRRKRVEHIIDRVVEVKKLELEEHDRTRRKSKTFSEMIEERGERAGGRGLNKLASLAVYAEDESNDLSDLGIGTSSASGKSSLSEDYDNNSVMSDNAAELDKAITNSTHHKPATESTTREYISSPGYETSSSTAPASSPDPCEYTYEGAIQDYKQRVSRAASGLTSVTLNKLTTSSQTQHNSKESTPERSVKETTAAYPPRRGSKIEDRLMGFEVQSPSSEECVEKSKVDVPKIDISKRKEIFEAQQQQQQQTAHITEPKSQLLGNQTIVVPRVTLRERFKVQETNTESTLTEQPKKELKRLSGDITSIKERLQSLEHQQNLVNGANGACKTTANKLVDIPVPPLKERLSSLQNAVTKEEIRKPPVVLVDARQLEIMKVEEEKAQQNLKETKEKASLESNETIKNRKTTEETEEIDRDDSGIHTADDVELEEQRLQADIMKKEQEIKLNAAIEALAKEEKQLSEAANAVNQIEAEFEELSLGSVVLPPLATATATASPSSASASATPITNDHMEYSVSSTNPLATKTYSPYNDNSSDSKSSISGISSGNIGSGNSDSTEVKGLDFKTNTNLRRKPTNEMVHAKNLLKIFKETFQNDLDIEEQGQNEKPEEMNAIRQENKENLGLNIKTQIYENSNTNIAISPTITKESTPQSPKLSNIPRCMTPLIGKPLMSPQTIRSTTKFVYQTPPGSPALARKTDSQFSINGRVEIFNSKTMTSPIKPTTPTMTTKKTQLPYIKPAAITPESLEIKSNNSNNIVLPQTEEATTKEQQQQQNQQIKTVNKPLLSTTNSSNGKIEQQMQSKPSQKMVNEPQIKLDNDDYQQQSPQTHQPNQSNNVAKSVKQQQQKPEIVVCAPPITIVNPDELPKPNTVKNLSSCFQHKDTRTNSSAVHVAKEIVPTPTPKPLPRSRIPQATPPQSPLLPRRHICYSSTQNLNSATSPLLEENKKLSIISSTSTSSTSTDSTVIDNNKKLSILSNASSTSCDVDPTIVKTNAQVHKIPDNVEESGEKDEKATPFISIIVEKEAKKLETVEKAEEHETKLAKTLDKTATKALVDEMIKTEVENRSLVLNTKFEAPLAPLKANVESPKETPVSTPVPSDNLTLNSDSSSVKTPTSPIFSPSAELFKTTTPLVVSTLYNNNHKSKIPQVPNNQRASSTKPKPSEKSPSIIVPAELPKLPICPPNESTLYKLATSAPHSPSSPSSNKSEKISNNSGSHTPTTPSSNSEQNLAIDSAICNSLMASLAATPDMMHFQRQHTVEGDLCQKVDKESLPFHQGTTGFKDITKSDLKKCEGLTPSTVSKLHGLTQRQKTVEEELCQKIDVHSLPDDKQQSTTGFKCVSPTEIRKCDNFFGLSASKPSSKPNSPIMEARAAHSKALIETCEKIIAEEKQASSQLKSSLPSSPLGTPIMQRKSKIPKPITSCCRVTESLNEADLKDEQTKQQPSTLKDENNAVIARMHVVETQIKVTTTTPPASPNAVTTKPQASPLPQKKTKNIFDFLKKNFGVGGSHSSKEEQQEPSVSLNTETAATNESNKVLVLTEKELQDLEEVKYDEVHKFDNSKFYLPSSDINDAELTATPPPLPKTPAPVNIEIRRKIITDEILEDGKTEKDLTKEIDDLLDDELNKLSQEIEKLEKAGQSQ